MTSMQLEFRSCKPSIKGNVRVVDGNYTQVMGKGSINASPNLSQPSMYVPQSVQNQVSLSSLATPITTYHILSNILCFKT